LSFSDVGIISHLAGKAGQPRLILLAADPSLTILHHGTTVQRASAIEADGPDPNYREPGTGSLPAAEGFSTVIGDGRPCSTGTPELAAQNKYALFPNEGGPAILEVSVPEWIMAILYADPIATGLARGGEIRFEPECGLMNCVPNGRTS
jgi:hypothetical protein